jgi:hypothetical protein
MLWEVLPRAYTLRDLLRHQLIPNNVSNAARAQTSAVSSRTICICSSQKSGRGLAINMKPLDGRWREWTYSDFVINSLGCLIADHGGRAVWGMNRFLPHEQWDCEFEFHSKHECLCASILCVGSGFATGWSPVEGVLPTVYRWKNWKRGQGPQGF